MHIYLLAIIILIAILTKRLSHTGDFFKTYGWRKRDFFFAYEVCLFAFIYVLITYPMLNWPKFNFSFRTFYDILCFEGTARIGFLFLIAGFVFNEYSSSKFEHLAKFRSLEIRFITVHNLRSIFVYVASINVQMILKKMSSYPISLLFIFLAAKIIASFFSRNRKIRRNKTLEDSVQHMKMSQSGKWEHEFIRLSKIIMKKRRLK